ncbi:MAG: DNA mismatch repair protein MutS [Thermoguttaceae bacterium]|jgi:DNA mismatch repair protein MutS
MKNDRTLTPMMRQYYAAKEAAQGALLLFRMGDFYELFNDDAYKAAKTLNITVTTRDRNKPNAMPMAGFPWQHLDNYLARLVKAGYRVAVCDQMENPKKTKSLVRREVTRIVTPGTLMDESMLDPKTSNYLAAIYISDEKTSRRVAKTERKSKMQSSLGPSLFELSPSEVNKPEKRPDTSGPPSAPNVNSSVSFSNVSTGQRSQDNISDIEPSRRVGIAWVELSTGYFSATTTTYGELFDHLARINPAECLIQEDVEAPFPDWALERTTLTRRPGWEFSRHTALETLSEHFNVETFEGFGFKPETSDLFALQASGAALAFLKETQKQSLAFISTLMPYRGSQYLEIDESTRRSLEIVQTYRDGRRDGSLLATIDHCTTSMGSRLLADWVACPLIDVGMIEQRQDAIEELVSLGAGTATIRSALRGVSDLERLISRIVQERGTPRELVNVAKTLRVLPWFKEFFEGSKSQLLQLLGERVSLQKDLCDELNRAFNEDSPLNYRDGGFINDGYSPELDKYRAVRRGNSKWLSDFQAREAARTGIPNLRVGFTSVFGFYIEISRAKGATAKIPEEYVRKQTLKNVERFTTQELRDYEEQALSADEKALELEMEIFDELQCKVAAVRAEIQRTASALAHLDVLVGLAELAVSRQYCRPKMVREPILKIKDGRHPVLDVTCASGEFVPNDSYCDDEKGYVHLITGPNMAGKSTFIRQTALLVLMAQMGSFIPAKEATIGVADRIFARVGASDELTRGQSTFMVEMIETARILNNATPKSLVILDEIGRGTSTYDGMALAWAIAEHIANKIKCRTFFATHYHELTDLSEVYSNVSNLNVIVREQRGNISFIHKIEEGSADKSYGVHVARLAGVPSVVVKRAWQILEGLEDARITETSQVTRQTLRDLTSKGQGKKKEDGVVQFSLFGASDHPVVAELRELDVESLSPMEALLMLARWKKELLNSDQDEES